MNIREEFSQEYIDQLIPMLQKALSDEISAAIGYVNIANKLIGKDVLKVQEELLEHAKEEFGHYTEIVQYCTLVGLEDIINDIELDYDVINYEPFDINETVDFIQSLELDAYNGYKDIVALATEYFDMTTCQKFKEIAGDERNHFQDLAYFNGDIFTEKYEIDEIIGDRDTQNKIFAKKKAIAKKKVKCQGDMTPHNISNDPKNPKYVCKYKDKQRAKIMKKVAKMIKRNPSLLKKKVLKAKDTKNFRYGK